MMVFVSRNLCHALYNSLCLVCDPLSSSSSFLLGRGEEGGGGGGEREVPVKQHICLWWTQV